MLSNFVHAWTWKKLASDFTGCESNITSAIDICSYLRRLKCNWKTNKVGKSSFAPSTEFVARQGGDPIIRESTKIFEYKITHCERLRPYHGNSRRQNIGSKFSWRFKRCWLKMKFFMPKGIFNQIQTEALFVLRGARGNDTPYYELSIMS